MKFLLPALLVVFTVSGFAGLIYESIWSHYLKLFLGHAAYAQTLVLAIFMGGMALGAWIASRLSARWRDLLLAYALIEAAIGLAALGFHGVFVAATAFSFERVIPALGSPFAVHAFKWTLGAALLLPQSILLGMTFPLMTGGVLRARPGRPGYAVAMLYFTNSLGAGIGVLASGFYFIEAAGLPGTLTVAGTLNLLVAAAVVLLRRGATDAPSGSQPAPGTAGSPVPMGRLLLAVAALTGMSSFMYEIGWIRMLALVLGGSTHAFELMLSAFILGIAFGGLWVRRRIDAAGDTVRLLAWVQVAMGLAALVAAGNFHTCGLTADGTAYCWGTNDRGQLGDGTVGGNQPAPVAVDSPTKFAKLAPGFAHTCAIGTDGLAYCWGWNRRGQIGDGAIEAPDATINAVVPRPARVREPPS